MQFWCFYTHYRNAISFFYLGSRSFIFYVNFSPPPLKATFIKSISWKKYAAITSSFWLLLLGWNFLLFSHILNANFNIFCHIGLLALALNKKSSCSIRYLLYHACLNNSSNNIFFNQILYRSTLLVDPNFFLQDLKEREKSNAFWVLPSRCESLFNFIRVPWSESCKSCLSSAFLQTFKPVKAFGQNFIKLL